MVLKNDPDIRGQPSLAFPAAPDGPGFERPEQPVATLQQIQKGERALRLEFRVYDLANDPPQRNNFLLHAWPASK
jgi:hypothetical protein